MKKLYFRSLFRGWVEITEQQRENLIKHMNEGITALKKEAKEEYINSRFKFK